MAPPRNSGVVKCSIGAGVNVDKGGSIDVGEGDKEGVAMLDGGSSGVISGRAVAEGEGITVGSGSLT